MAPTQTLRQSDQMENLEKNRRSDPLMRMSPCSSVVLDQGHFEAFSGSSGCSCPVFVVWQCTLSPQGDQSQRGVGPVHINARMQEFPGKYGTQDVWNVIEHQTLDQPHGPFSWD